MKRHDAKLRVGLCGRFSLCQYCRRASGVGLVRKSEGFAGARRFVGRKIASPAEADGLVPEIDPDMQLTGGGVLLVISPTGAHIYQSNRSRFGCRMVDRTDLATC